MLCSNVSLSTLHPKTCCCKAHYFHSWRNTCWVMEPRGTQPCWIDPPNTSQANVMCEQVSQNYFAVNENDLAAAKLIWPWRKWFCRGEIDFAVSKLILPWRKWFCHGEIDFAVSIKILPWQLWATVTSTLIILYYIVLYSLRMLDLDNC